MDAFYVTLPSNSSMQYYPDNTLAAFTTMLPNMVELLGDWEVGLVEIQYPYNWNNVSVDSESRTFSLSVQTVTDWVDYSFTIPPGYYPNIMRLLSAIVTNANTTIQDPNFKLIMYNLRAERKVRLGQKTSCTLTVPLQLQQLLGLEQSTLNAHYDRSSKAVDLEPVNTLFVYCDIVEPRVVGDSLVPLLRIVPVEGEHGKLITHSYQNVHYFKVQKKTFQNIEVNIRDHTGKKVSFESGTLNVTLHFRRHKRLSTL